MKIKNILPYVLVLLSFTITVNAQKKLVILHTNDTHSRIEALPSTDAKYPNTAGVVARKAFIDKVRKNNKDVLLFDVGDFVQGTPYFNLYHGRVEAGAMNLMKYDAGTIGNHEFDYGVDTLKMIIEKLNFPIVSCNYDFSNTVLKDLVKPYVILNKYGLKIGVIGIGADPEGLIQKNRYTGMIFKPVIETVNHYAQILKQEEKCDIVICLSHTGYSSDIVLAEKSTDIDLILGGHSHTYMEQPEFKKNLNGTEVMIFQVGKSGSFVGEINVELEKIK